MEQIEDLLASRSMLVGRAQTAGFTTGWSIEIEAAEAFKRVQRETWASGDFDTIAKRIWPVGGELVSRVGVGRGERVLDVAAGTGNAAVQAAQAGAEVVAADLTPELFEAGRRNAAEVGVEVEWVEADAEQLPFEDGRFDVVLSTFGCMFAPRHAVTAAELVRVLAPGGRMGLCCWTPEGAIGDFFRTIGAYMGPPVGPDASPLAWGDETYARGLLEASRLELDFERLEAEFGFGDAEQAVGEYEAWFGPIVLAKRTLEAEGQGRWPQLRADLLALFEASGRRDSGGLAFAGEYLLIQGRRPEA